MAFRNHTIEPPGVCQVCKHKKLVYIGKQNIDRDGKDFLALFNCQACHSTISLRMKKQQSPGSAGGKRK